MATAPPAVSGSTQVGAKLTAMPGTWSVAGLTYEYEWLRSGVPVAGATSASYTLTSADLGARLAVRVVATKQGHATGEATSAQSAVVTAPPTTGTAPKALVKPFVLGLPKVGSPLLAFPGVWSATDVRLTFQWLRDGQADPGRDVVRLHADDRGQGCEARRPGHGDEDRRARGHRHLGGDVDRHHLVRVAVADDDSGRSVASRRPAGPSSVRPEALRQLATHCELVVAHVRGMTWLVRMSVSSAA